MPELPDITIYLEALEKRILHRILRRVQINSPFLVRTALPPLTSLEGKKVLALRRVGKRICLGMEDDLWLVLHLMIAGRLHWKDSPLPVADSSTRKGLAGRQSATVRGAGGKSRNLLALFEFDNGSLSLTEAGTQRRASLHLIDREKNLRTLDAGGVDLFQRPARKTEQANSALGEFIDLQSFGQVLQSENHTLKRALTDPRLFSGIGNAYSDEILWEARLSPVKLTQKLAKDEVRRLHEATRKTVVDWVERLRADNGDQFPEKVTAFRKGMAVHGRYKENCPRCGAKVQRIRYATNETNYCPTCQTGGKLLADRALSRLLREDWPKTAEELG